MTDKEEKKEVKESETKVAAPKLVEEVKESPEKVALRKQIQDCLKEHDGMESNIGINHPYWGWQNQLRSMK